MDKKEYKTNPYMEDWKKSIDGKTKDELVNIVRHKTDYDTEYIELVEQQLKNEYGITVAFEEPKKNACMGKRSEIQILRDIGGKLPVCWLIVICTLLSLFVIICVVKIHDSFLYSSYWNVMWWGLLAFCISNILIQLIIGKVIDKRNNNDRSKSQM